MPKGAEAFRTISEAAEELGVAQHVLRFWETKFSFIRPMKRAGGRRFYRPSDISVLAAVRRLLHQEGYTIKGVQKLYRETGLRLEAGEPAATTLSPVSPPTNDNKGARIRSTLAVLERAKTRLDQALGRT
ncbi:MAG TPA: MerR family transcriptional regulator [Caulobacteraceae bacterium]